MTDESSSSSTSSIVQQQELHLPLRIGTWNVLLYEDEYDLNYGCPLSIAFCMNTSTTTTTTGGGSNDIRKRECTKQRQQRIWNIIEASYEQYDLLCLQEVNDDFISLQRIISNWTMIHRNMECVLFLSSNSTFSVITTYTIRTIPNLSGCTALPMVVLQQPQQEQEQVASNNSSNYATNSPITYIVGSVHVQASVTNMSIWYQSTIDAIVNNTYNEVVLLTGNHNNTTSTVSNEYHWMKQPVMIIVAGDFNKNLTTGSNVSTSVTSSSSSSSSSSTATIVPMIEQPPDKNWTIVSPNDIVIHGTTQKEYNFMGYYDGFLYTTTSIRLYIPENDTIVSSSSSTALTNENSAISYYYSMNVINASIHTMDGFMPKVLYGFPQNNHTIQDVAQFALISTSSIETNNMNHTDPKNQITNELSNYTLWNASTVQHWMDNNHNNSNSSIVVPPMDLQFIFSKSSNFPFTSASTTTTNNNNTNDDHGNDTIVVLQSHPLLDSLSDHLFIAASFHVVLPTTQQQQQEPPHDSNSINNNSTNNDNNDPSSMDKPTDEPSSSSSSSHRPNLSPVGWTLVVIGIVVCIGILLRLFGYCRRRRCTNVSSRSHEFDRISADVMME
jgi:hypothetical protein